MLLVMEFQDGSRLQINWPSCIVDLGNYLLIPFIIASNKRHRIYERNEKKTIVIGLLVPTGYLTFKANIFTRLVRIVGDFEKA